MLGYKKMESCLMGWVCLCHGNQKKQSLKEIERKKVRLDTNMSEKMIRKRLSGIFLFVCLFSVASFPSCCSAASNQPHDKKKRMVSSAIFPVQGNVYPLGYYYASVKIGNPPKVYDLDIDTGSDLTWVQCDAPCVNCNQPRHKLYKPNDNLLHCVDPICSAIQSPGNKRCKIPTDQCDYEVGYADLGSSMGVLVTDDFPLKFSNGSTLGPRLAFGCGYDQIYGGHGSPPPLAGVLGLGNGKAGILSQLTQMGLTRNVIGHCLSSRGGYFFFGDDFIPSSGISWIPISSKTLDKHYSSGPADIHFGGQPSGVKGINVIFDSGSSYTYLSSRVYETVVNMVKAGLIGAPIKIASEDQTLPICWKGNKAYRSVQDTNNLFPTLSLIFTKAKKVQLHLPPEAYLIVSKHGNACLGILNGTQVELGNHNVIGDISLLGKMVIYDNENKQIGWGHANCDRLPNMDDEQNGDFSSPFATSFGTAWKFLKVARGPKNEL